MSDPLHDNDHALKQALVDIALGKPFIPRFVQTGIEVEGEPEVPKANVRLEALKFALTYEPASGEESPLSKMSLEDLRKREADIQKRQAIAGKFKVTSDSTSDRASPSGREPEPDPVRTSSD